MFYTVYKTTNTVNTKEYIGVHITNNLKDNYLGSGVILTKAINKYGVNKFNKTIVFRAISKDIAYWVERMLVTEEYVLDKNTYNLTRGGKGGFSHITEPWNKGKIGVQIAWNKGITGKYFVSAETKLKMSLSQSKENNGFYNKVHSAKCKEDMSKKKMGNNNPMFDKHHSDETKLKMSLAKQKPQQKVICPYCKKEGEIANMKRYHFENCKFKEKCEYFN